MVTTSNQRLQIVQMKAILLITCCRVKQFCGTQARKQGPENQATNKEVSSVDSFEQHRIGTSGATGFSTARIVRAERAHQIDGRVTAFTRGSQH